MYFWQLWDSLWHLRFYATTQPVNRYCFEAFGLLIHCFPHIFAFCTPSASASSSGCASLSHTTLSYTAFHFVTYHLCHTPSFTHTHLCHTHTHNFFFTHHLPHTHKHTNTNTHTHNFVTPSTTSFVYPSFPVLLELSVSAYWKKLTCGAFRSFKSQKCF